MLNYILAHLHHGEEGQTMAEYAIVLAVITAAVVAALALLSGNVRDAINGIAGELA